MKEAEMDRLVKEYGLINLEAAGVDLHFRYQQAKILMEKLKQDRRHPRQPDNPITFVKGGRPRKKSGWSGKIEASLGADEIIGIVVENVHGRLWDRERKRKRFG